MIEDRDFAKGLTINERVQDRLPVGWRAYVGADMDEADAVTCPLGEVRVLVRKRPGRLTRNEDSALVAPIDDERLVLAAADGAGGLPEGAQASALAIGHLAAALLESTEERSIPDRIEIGLRRAHAAIAALQCGAATTANVVFIERDRLWSFHVGDSMTCVVTADGDCKLRTIAHSPVGEQVGAGELSDEQAIHHADLHLVSRLLGVGDSGVDRIDRLSTNVSDTVVIATDGLFDNLLTREVLSRARQPSLDDAVNDLAMESWRRMTAPGIDDPCKPDDMALILFRPHAPPPPSE